MYINHLTIIVSTLVDDVTECDFTNVSSEAFIINHIQNLREDTDVLSYDEGDDFILLTTIITNLLDTYRKSKHLKPADSVYIGTWFHNVNKSPSEKKLPPTLKLIKGGKDELNN